MNKQSCVLFVMAAIFASGRCAAGDASAKVPCGMNNPLNLSVTAMLDGAGNTVVSLDVVSRCSQVPAPTQILVGRLVSVDRQARERWVQQVKNLALVPDASGLRSSAQLTYSGLKQHQPLGAVMVAKDKSATLLLAATTVQERPDLQVEQLSAPSSAFVGQVVNVTAILRELGGDLGATTNLVLSADEDIIDFATAVVVEPAGSVEVAFSAVFDAPGLYTLSVVPSGTTPADYDVTNDAALIQIEVVDPIVEEAVPYWLSYKYTTEEYHREWQNEYGIYTRDWTGASERLEEMLTLPHAVIFPCDAVEFAVDVDGVLFDEWLVENVAETSNVGGLSRAVVQIEGGYTLYINNLANGTAQVQLVKRAVDRVHYSTGHQFEWGNDWQTSSHEINGVMLEAEDVVTTRLFVEDDSVRYGGGAGLDDLVSAPYNQQWNNVTATGYDRGYLRGVNTSDEARGQTAL